MFAIKTQKIVYCADFELLQAFLGVKKPNSVIFKSKKWIFLFFNEKYVELMSTAQAKALLPVTTSRIVTQNSAYVIPVSPLAPPCGRYPAIYPVSSATLIKINAVDLLAGQLNNF